LKYVIVIGSGVVGAMIAYELSLDWRVTLIDRAPHPASGSTGAALGLLMGIISQKVKGIAWRRREAGILYYHQLLPRLTAITGIDVPYNDRGLLKLIEKEEERSKWQALATLRQTQGWPLEIWDKIPENLAPAAFAIYSPADWQVHPAQLTCALVAAAANQGVKCLWGRTVTAIRGNWVQTNREELQADWIVVAAGLGSGALAQGIDLQLAPVLGQAIYYRSGTQSQINPVITREDVHLVPLGNGDYWVGATLEFPVGATVTADSQEIDQLRQRAIDYFPFLADAQELKTWSGLRPRPVGRPAPVIEQLSDCLLIATGHYRNGVLLAPATASEIRARLS
jgi:glycine/D-amino acid oxidase-like deaminating enzyme